MKKVIGIFLAVCVALLAVLFVPLPQAAVDDGGTRVYTALTYTVVDWHRVTPDGVYEQTRLYTGDDRRKTLDELWEAEAPYVTQHMTAVIIERFDTSVIVAPLEDENERLSADRITFGTAALEDIDAAVGSVVEVTYRGGIMESYPAQIDAVSWTLATDLRELTYTGQWLDKTTATAYDHDIFGDITITAIYADCFFARPVIPMPYEIKLNGALSEEWCVGDRVICTYENTYYDEDLKRAEADMLTIEASDRQPDPEACYKPVIYLYPEEETEVAVTLTLDGRLTCTYPAYQNGWRVTAAPDGTLTDESGQTYNYLYWEGETYARYDFSAGFCVKGEDTAAFLEEALDALGLTRREANEFIVYWLPLMQENPYNVIAFQTDAYTDAAQLAVTPAPDTLIRVFMAWHAADDAVAIPPQTLTAPTRDGFTVVEWGGTEVK